MRLTRGWIVLVLVLCIVADGCGSKDLSRSKAADLIEKSENFGTVKDIKIPTGHLWYDWRNVGVFKPLQDAGLVTLRESGQKQGYWSKEYVFELTPRGEEVSKTWATTTDALPRAMSGMRCWTIWGQGETCHEANGVVYSAVLAHRKLDQITGIVSDATGRTSRADFNWHWEPTDNNKMFPNQVSAGPQQGVAGFQLYDDGWRLVEIEFGG
jgi:hypothetical protein